MSDIIIHCLCGRFSGAGGLGDKCRKMICVAIRDRSFTEYYST